MWDGWSLTLHQAAAIEFSAHEAQRLDLARARALDDLARQIESRRRG